MEGKTQLRPEDSSQNLPLQSYSAGLEWIRQPKNETLKQQTLDMKGAKIIQEAEKSAQHSVR